MNRVIGGLFGIDDNYASMIAPMCGAYRVLANAYKTRVENDGGTLVDLDAVISAYQLIGSQSLAPAAWWSADFGYKNAGSGSVSKLYDLSSNNNDAAQATSSLMPVWTNSKLNSKPGLACDGGDKLSFTTIDAMTVLVVADKDAVSNKGVVLSYSSDSNNYIALANAATGNAKDYCMVEAASNSEAPTGDVNTPRILTMYYESKGGNLSLARNGTYGSAVDQSNTQNVGYFNTLFSYSSASYSLDGDFYEICLFTTALTLSTRQAIESYLSTKWGIT